MNKLRLAALGLTALLVAALLLPAFTPDLAAQVPTPSEGTPQRTISTSGTGRVSVQPDYALVSLGVTTDAEEAAEAMTDNNTAMQAVIDALLQAGIPTEDIQTRLVSLNPRYEPPQPPDVRAGELIGYQASNLVEVRLEDFAAIGDLLDAAVQAGANNIQSISWQVDDQVSVLDQAREMAWEAALHRAEQLAGLAGVALGPVMSISESSGPIIPLFADLRAEVAAGVPVQPGTQDVEVIVSVTWQLVDAAGGAGGTSIPKADTTPGATGTPTPQAAGTGGTSAASANEVTIELVADGNQFSLDTITVPAGAHVVVEFTNEDSVPHNLAVYTNEDAEEEIFVGQTITGPGETITYEFDAPDEEGTYFFRCDIHPTMNGELIVE